MERLISKEQIITLADNMAAAASQLNTMTYDQLMTSRSQLIAEVEDLFDKAIIRNTTDSQEWYPFRNK